MFKAANPYDEVVMKATDENLTSESWELNLDVCDKVSGEGEAGARNCILAIQKRLVHRSANVQLYSLTLSDMLAKNCGLDAHRELASRAFTSTLTRIVSDRNTHDKVKKRALELIKTWSGEWEGEPSLGLMKETGETLKRQGFSFDEEISPAPAEPSSDVLRAEDEELRKVLELSMRDQGGRNAYNSTANYPGEASGSSSSATAAVTSASGLGSTSNFTAPTSSGYVPGPSASSNQKSTDKALPNPSRESSLPTQQTSTPAASSSSTAHVQATSSGAPSGGNATTSNPPVAASRVRALYDFSPTEAGELPFQKGDIIRVLDSVYEHWWRGELKGEAGIFPVNYVEILPDRTPDDTQREAELEARIFAQATNIDKLLSKLRGLDASADNLAEDDELQELYQTSLSMRPKIVRLIDRYSTKITELKSMNDKFVRARGIFDAAMEESLARHNPGARSHEYTQSRPEYQAVQQQAQQDYSAQWAAYYANLHAQGQTQSQPTQGHPQLQQPQSQEAQQQADAYAKWYWSQQQVQQQTQQPHQQQQPPQPSNGADYSQYYAQQQAQAAAGQGAPIVQVQSPTPQEAQAPMALPSPRAEAPGSGHGSQDPNAPEDSEKRRLYERARAEAEAYHSQHAQQQAQAGGSGSGAGSTAGLQQSMAAMNVGN